MWKQEAAKLSSTCSRDGELITTRSANEIHKWWKKHLRADWQLLATAIVFLLIIWNRLSPPTSLTLQHAANILMSCMLLVGPFGHVAMLCWLVKHSLELGVRRSYCQCCHACSSESLEEWEKTWINKEMPRLPKQNHWTQDPFHALSPSISVLSSKNTWSKLSCLHYHAHDCQKPKARTNWKVHLLPNSKLWRSCFLGP